MKTFLTVALMLGVVTARPSWALVFDTVFIPERRDELCGPPTGGRRVVDRQRLLQALVDDGSVPLMLLDRANPAGRADGVVTRDELLYALTANRPFGPGPEAELGQHAKKAVDRLREVRGLLGDFLTQDGAPQKGYRVVKPGVRTLRPRDLFDPSSGLEIECVALPGDQPAEATTKEGWAEVTARAIGERLRIRGKVEGLPVPRDQLEEAEVETADIAFKRDERARTDTFQIRGVVGYELGGALPWVGWQLIPYVRYERTDLTPNSAKKSDVHVVSPGAMVSSLFGWSRAAIEIGIAPEATLDIRQDSEIVKAKAFLTPSFRIGPEDRSIPILGGFGPELGPFSFRQEIRLLGEMSYVVDSGSNSALTDERPYVGVGAEGGLKVRLPNVPLLSGVVGSADYRHLQLFGTRLANAHRLQTSLSYRLSPNLTLKWAYEDGRNEETFQKERFWNLSLGLRY